MSKVIIQYAFTREEALIAQAKNPGAKLCDKNNFSFFDFKDKEIVAGDDSAQTTYLVAKAEGKNPKPVKAK